ncbi:DUF1289 domain-containing protein [Brucellaceae bacterium C25G]
MIVTNAKHINNLQPITSPCVLVCNIDDQTGLCLGCARTLQEIARWSTMSDIQKKEVIALLPARHRQLQAKDI